MKFIIISSLLIGIFSFLGLCISDFKAEFSVQSNPFNPIKLLALEPKLIRRAQEWTSKEEERLLELREQGISWSKIAELLPGRSWSALSTRYYKLKKDPSAPKKPKGQPWTDEEQEILVELMKTKTPWEEIAKNLPGRSMLAIKGKYNSFFRDNKAPKVFKRKYTAEEDELLLELNREGIPWNEIRTRFEDRSLSSLQSRFRALIALERSSLENFTSEEDELLLELQEAGMPWNEILTRFDNQSLSSLQSRFETLTTPKMKGKFTSREDDLLVEALESGKQIEEICQLLNRTTAGIRRRIKKLDQLNRLDLGPQRLKGRRYTVADLKLMEKLRKNGVPWADVATDYFPGRDSATLTSAYARYRARKQREEEKE